jgi:hypothetical protein
MKRRLWPLVPLVALGMVAPSPATASDPTTADCLAASEASLTARNEHRLRAARNQSLICAAQSCPADVRKECLRHVDELNPAIPTVIFDVKDASGHDLTAVRATMDGEVLAERLEGTPLAIDPGNHTFRFETVGQAPVTTQLVILESQKDRRESVVFGNPAAPPTPASPREAPPSSGLGTQRILGIAAAGVGVVGVGLGSVFGAMMLSKKSDAQLACSKQCSDPNGVSQWNDAVSNGNLATAFWIVGGVGIAGAAVLWFTAPSASAPSAQVGLVPGMVQVKGTW